ncbi:MAG TPA: hypothetical protein ENG24_02010 [Thermoplasmatales archaeon]|nr:hypothetical protein [Thermoplasmatales archaeon]
MDPVSHGVKIDTGKYLTLYDFSSKHFSTGSAAFERDRVLTSPPLYFSEGIFGSLLTNVGLRTAWFEYEFSEDEYNNISSIDNKYASTMAKSPGHAVQHFLFKIIEPRRNVEKLYVKWQGYGENSKGKVYCWNYTSKNFDKIGAYEITSKNSEIMKIFPVKDVINHVDTDGYVHIVFETDERTRVFGETVGISTNYIGLVTEGTKYVKEGYLQSKEIHVDKSNISRWGYFVWNDYTPSDSKIVYRVYMPVEHGVAGAIKAIDDKYLPGNSKGFTSPPVDLSKIPVNYTDTLILCANFSASSNGIFTPRLYDWGITWQKRDNSWVDRFSTSYRIESSKGVSVKNGNVTISNLPLDWPIFGKNVNNQRIIDGHGAQSNSLLWRTGTGVGGLFCSPVLKDGILYITSADGSVSARDALNGGMGGTIYWKTTGLGSFVSSPTITENLVIVASSKPGEANKVYALDRKTGNITWEYQYDQSTPFCYYSPPVVHNEKVYVTAVKEKQSIWDLSKPIYKLLALSKQDGRLLWEFDLPAAVYAPPAIDNGVLFVGCANENGSSLFAIDEDTGSAIWENDMIGAVGRAAPVLYDGKIYVVSVENKTVGPPSIASVALYSINKTDGTIANSTYLGEINTQDILNLPIIKKILGGKLIRPIPPNAAASSTPVIYNNIVFVGSPDGTVHALDAETLEDVQQPFETSGNYLFSSPAIAENTLYIASYGNINPQTFVLMKGGTIYAISLDSWSEKWHYDAMLDATITSSPIVSNGILYISDDDGRLYAIGSYKKSYNLEGTFVSNVIEPPTGKWWDKISFLLKGSGSCKIDILDENGVKILDNIKNGDNISSLTSKRIRLAATLQRSSEIQNPALKYWKLTWKDENDCPYGWRDLYPQGWWNKEKANCSISVKDPTSGLDVTSAKYRINYTMNILHPSNLTSTKVFSLLYNESSYFSDFHLQNYTFTLQGDVIIISVCISTPWEKAYCTGTNGTKDLQTIIAFDVPLTINSLRNTLPLDIFEEYIGPYNVNFSLSMNGVEFQISDLAGNVNNSKTYPIKVDTKPPFSEITFPEPSGTYNGFDWYGTEDIPLTVTVKDDKSGPSETWLYYKYSENGANWSNWTLFANITPPSGETTFSAVKDGFYEICSIASDIAGNYENPDKKETTGNVSFIAVDTHKPMAHYDPEVEHWYNNSAPEIKINFTDNMVLKSIEYQLSNATWSSNWETIADDIDSRFYNEAFQIDSSIWQSINPRLTYYLIFRINDYGNNINTTEEPYKIGKDIDRPRSEIQEFNVKWHSSLPIKVTAIAGDGTSFVSKVTLYYSYSPDNKTWTSWKVYEEGKYIGNGTWEWEFDAPNGNGYYKFYTVASDEAGNVESKEGYEIVTGVNVLPLTQIIIAIVLLIIAVILGVYIRSIRRK